MLDALVDIIRWKKKTMSKSKIQIQMNEDQPEQSRKIMQPQ